MRDCVSVRSLGPLVRQMYFATLTIFKYCVCVPPAEHFLQHKKREHACDNGNPYGLHISSLRIGLRE